MLYILMKNQKIRTVKRKMNPYLLLIRNLRKGNSNEQANKLSVMKTIKQEPEEDELTINQTKWGRRRSTGRVVHLDEE